MKRLKKILKWTGIVLGTLTAILLVVNAWFVWTTGARLESQLAAIRAAGDPVTLADLARPPIPPEQNAATYLERAKADVMAIVDEVYKDAATAKYLDVSSDPPMPADIQKTIKAAFDAHPNVIPLLEQAADCPDYDAQLDYTVPPEEFVGLRFMELMGEYRNATRMLCCRVRLLTAEGNCDEAVRTAMVALRLARHYDRNPMAINSYTGGATRLITVVSINETLQSGAVSEEVRISLDTELALHESMDPFFWTLKSEQAYTVDVFRRMRDVSFDCNSWFLSRAIWNRREYRALDVFQAFLALPHNPVSYREMNKMVDEKLRGRISYPPGSKSPNSFFGYNTFGFYAEHERMMADGLLLGAVRMLAGIRTLRVLNALQSHAMAGSDEAPKLTELGLSAETTTDPFTGEPLHVKKTPRGWLVYSVGPNYRDDDRKLDDPQNDDFGFGPPPVAQ